MEKNRGVLDIVEGEGQLQSFSKYPSSIFRIVWTAPNRKIPGPSVRRKESLSVIQLSGAVIRW